MIQLGRIGMWASMNGMTATAAAGFALRVERFLLGLGASRMPLVAGLRRHIYGKPVEAVRAPVEAMRRAGYAAPPPPEPPRTATAALGPNA